MNVCKQSPRNTAVDVHHKVITMMKEIDMKVYVCLIHVSVVIMIGLVLPYSTLW